MKKDVIITVLATFALTITLFTVIPIYSQSVGDYDHWLDINDDGTIDMKDIATVARAYGTYGTAINKTELLLELEQRISDVELVCLLMPEIRARLDSLERVSFVDDFNDQILDGWTQFPSRDRFAI
jgi:hypothetical protein